MPYKDTLKGTFIDARTVPAVCRKQLHWALFTNVFGLLAFSQRASKNGTAVGRLGDRAS